MRGGGRWGPDGPQVAQLCTGTLLERVTNMPPVWLQAGFAQKESLGESGAPPEASRGAVLNKP